MNADPTIAQTTHHPTTAGRHGETSTFRRSSRLRRSLACAATFLLATTVAAGGKAPRSGTVVCAQPAATEVGLDILRAGGNATDAAAGVALALAVVHPEAGNLLGGGFALVRFGGDVAALDFREVAPAAATAKMYLGPDGAPIPNASLVGPLAAGVPGSPVGLYELQHRYGRLPWRRVVEPAVRLARDGFVLSERTSQACGREKELLATFPETAAVWLPGGKTIPAGTRVTLPRLAKALEAYGRRGPRALMQGSYAAAIVNASKAHGGIITLADLAGYRAVWRVPVRFRAFGWELASMPLPSSGGIILAQTFGLLERMGWAKEPAGGAESLHLLIEAFRRAFADRFLLGDPATTQASERELLDTAWLDRRAAGIDRGHATPSTEVKPWSGQPPQELPQTTHLSVVDGDGNAVSVTTTLNGAFGCGLLVPEMQSLLNNEMDDFATAPGKPNLYGLIQGEANAVGPGKRMLSSMSPTIAWRGDDVIAVGSPGGSRIPTATAQVLLGVLVQGKSLQAAVDAARIHHQWLPDEVDAEAGSLSGEVRAELERMGHRIVACEKIGEVHAARRRADGTLEAAADPRGPGASGVTPRPQ